LIREPSYDGSLVVSATENTHAATVKAAVSDEHQPGCFALEEEKGDHWAGSEVSVIKEARPSL
jgi:hypothetical protein